MWIFLGLGTNLGDKEANLRCALRKIEEQIGSVVSLSTFHLTAPWGFTSSHAFLNAACCVETTLSPTSVLKITQTIEREMGRSEKTVGGNYHDRLIDIDLLVAIADDGTSLTHDSPELKLPHPLLKVRDFVLQPLAEIVDISKILA